MQTFLNSLIFFVLSAFGLSTYFLNPYRSGSLIVGLLLQAFAIVVLFLSTVSQKHALNRYKNAAKDTVQSNRSWLIGSIAAVCISGALLLIGIPYSFLRFILFLLLWLGAIGAGQYLCYFIWQSGNKDLVQQLAAEGIIQREQEKQAKEAAVQRKKEEQERQEAIAAQQRVQRGIEPLPQEIPDSLPVSVTRQRVEDMPDLMFAMRLMAGDESALAEAFAHPTRNLLAAIEDVIARNYICYTAIFYRNGGLIVTTQSSIQEVQDRLMFLVKSHQLCVNPAWSQYLISQLGKDLANNFLMKINQSCEREDVFAFQLLIAEMQIAYKLHITLE